MTQVKFIYDQYKYSFINFNNLFSKQNDDLPYFPDYLKIAMENKDDELVKAFYDLYFNHIGYNEKITIVENFKSNIEKLLKENYNQYSNAILQDLLDLVIYLANLYYRQELKNNEF